DGVRPKRTSPRRDLTNQGEFWGGRVTHPDVGLVTPLRTLPTALDQLDRFCPDRTTPRGDSDQTGRVLGQGDPSGSGLYDPTKNSSQGPLPIRVQHHHLISPSARRTRPSLTKDTWFRNRGKAAERKPGLLHHPRENFGLCLRPEGL
ncbi:hypothetical protein KIL84_009409, partial [Mauremys mutica]